MDFGLVTGVDIIDINRVRDILARRQDAFINKIFTEAERTYIKRKSYRPETIAGLFAGKEAISKALGTGIGRLGWKDMEITHNSRGRPSVSISEEIVKKYGLLSLEISISHEKNYAVASVVGLIRPEIGKKY